MNSTVIYLAHVHKLRIKMKNVEFQISEFDANCRTLLLLNFIIVKISIYAKVCLCLYFTFQLRTIRAI